MNDVYQFGTFVFTVFGFGYAILGLVRGDCPFCRGGVYADSAVTRAACGIGIGAIWPAFLSAVFLWSVIGYFAKKRGADSSRQKTMSQLESYRNYYNWDFASAPAKQGAGYIRSGMKEHRNRFRGLRLFVPANSR